MNEQQKAIAEIVRNQIRFEDEHISPRLLINALANYFAQENERKGRDPGWVWQFDRAAFVAKCYGKEEVTT